MLVEAYASGRAQMPDMSNGRGPTKCSPWSSRLRAGRGLTTAPRKYLLLRNREGGQDPHRDVAPVKKTWAFLA
jgi:hypothetical protein